MSLKIKIIFIAILIGVISFGTLNNLQAAEITSVFNGEKMTRETLGGLSIVNSTEQETLGITDSGYRTNNGEVYWKIVEKDGKYIDLYCLNLSRGFGAPDGSIYESGETLIDSNGNKVVYNTYNKQLDLNTITSNDYQNYTGLDIKDKEKILWILNNSVTSTQDLKAILTLASEKVEEAGWASYVKEDMKKNNDPRTALTFEDVKIVQQIALWQYTNPENKSTTKVENIFYDTITGICDSNGNQISSKGENILIDTDTYYNYVRSGIIKQAKINALYKYFIDGAKNQNSEIVVPTLNLDNTKAIVNESGEHYIVGPFTLNATNQELIKEINTNVSENYTLLNSSKNVVTNNDFTKVIGNNFYLKINKSEVAQSTSINITLTYKYDIRNLTLMSNNNATNTQPIVLIRVNEESKNVSTSVDINLTNVYVEKVWEDNNNQDGVRPTSVKVQLYKDSSVYGNIITLNSNNNWKYTCENLLDGSYTVKEINNNGNAVLNGGKYNNDYTTTYNSQGNRTTIKNTHIPTTIGIKGTKTWQDNNNQDGERPQNITVNLLANGTEIKEITFSADKDYEFSFTNLPKYKDGREIVYTITEDTVENYSTKINGYNIVNSYNPETIEKTVTKVWDDNYNQDGKRTEYGVTLKANGKVYGEEIILNSETLSYTWENLPKYSEGEEIEYTVEETNIPLEYTPSYSEDTFTITNKYTPGKVSKKVVKVWDDQENKDKIRPENVTVKLFKEVNGQKTEIDSKVLDENNNWSHVWSQLDQKENGVEIIYSIEEIPVEKYTTTYSAEDYNDTDEIIITNTYIPVEITGKYNVILRKTDENGNILPGSKFEINNIEYDLSNGEIELLEDTDILSTDDIILTYNIKETQVPNGYIGIEDTTIQINAKVMQEGTNYKITRINGTLGEENESIPVILEGNTIIISIKNKPVEKEFDLALRKFITAVNDIEYSREPVVDTSKLGTIVDGKTVTTATYKHTKQPIAVQKGDVVTYTIRVYNEGEIDGYVDKITDYLPDNILPIIVGTEGIDENKYAKEIEFNLNWGWVISEDGKSVTTMKTSKVNSDTYSMIEGYEDVTDTKLNAYVEDAKALDYIDVQIKCLVTNNAIDGEFITNIAEITESKDINGNIGDGSDSKLGNVDYSNLSDYKNNESINSTTESYIAGQEDDDDFEKLVVKEFDLSLRKFITAVNDVKYLREPVVDTSKLRTVINNKLITTATYYHSKEPVIVETSDLVTYKIRIYNEGSIAGFANEVTDNIPEGLEFILDSDINKQYRWKMLDKEGIETEDVSKAVIITTDYLSNRDENNIIKEVSYEQGSKILNYKDIEVQFKVIAKPEKLKDNIIINEAQISEDSDRDIDSIPNRDEKYDYSSSNNEDDIDYEPIKLQYYDLALRKFVTKVNNTEYNNRYPEIIYNDNGDITYSHTKDPVLVTNGDTVVYTIRVYNEGEVAGYAKEIKDNLPEGLAFDPNNEINKQYKWEMIDSEGKVTQEAEKVVAFKTKYLENEKIDVFVNSGSKILSFKDVKIAFKVTESNLSDRILVNIAQISEDSDDDIDSTPDNNVEKEDDLDKEYIRVQYFDLSLKKWVTETKVTLDGKTTTTKTGFKEDSEGIAKVDIVASKLKKTTVKFVYNIKVTNEGELPGYVYEIKDYIPAGLKFVAEDNKDWKEEKDGIVVTDKLKDTLLNPGESATVEIVLTWKNSSTNLGLKTNYAEISKDSADDIDSNPDNYDFTEDDIDDAQVILSIKTAGKTTYIGLVLISIVILAGGVFIIKKYVLE